uniref:Uncharacterized protein n=1 Tax=Rhizophora mucronata TaxID=61149 RepID=A0A2P2IH59_RHIMU
MVLAYQTNKKP